jgi:adenylate cyclase
MTTGSRLSDLSRCFQGVVPSVIATSDAKGVPNLAYLSQVYFVDEQHVALSRQFFNKTQRNLDENPLACLEMIDPLTLQAYRLRLTFLRSERSGPLFETMAMRIEAIASHTGMSGVFKLVASDVFEVRSIEKVDGFLTAAPADLPHEGVSLEGRRTEVRGLQWVSERINRAADLESLLAAVLEALEEYFHFAHTIVLLYDEPCGRLITMASRGYGQSGVGAEVMLGQGLIGTAARERRLLRFKNLDSDLRYVRTIRRESPEAAGEEIPLPGLPDPQSVLVIPLTVGDRLIGVLAAEDRDPVRFGEWHEAYLQIIANQIALGIDRMADRGAEEAEAGELPADLKVSPTSVVGPGLAVGPGLSPAVEAGSVVGPGFSPADQTRKKRTLTYYRNDDAIFVDGEYLIRNIPARILWKLLAESQRAGRTDFTNREVRLDESLGLPPVKDNFESRLILLRHRLKEKCPVLQIVPTGRGRFSLRIEGSIEMIER